MCDWDLVFLYATHLAYLFRLLTFDSICLFVVVVLYVRSVLKFSNLFIGRRKECLCFIFFSHAVMCSFTLFSSAKTRNQRAKEMGQISKFIEFAVIFDENDINFPRKSWAEAKPMTIGDTATVIRLSRHHLICLGGEMCVFVCVFDAITPRWHNDQGVERFFCRDNLKNYSMKENKSNESAVWCDSHLNLVIMYISNSFSCYWCLWAFEKKNYVFLLKLNENYRMKWFCDRKNKWNNQLNQTGHSLWIACDLRCRRFESIEFSKDGLQILC